jgi:hypothetical protein
LKYALNYFNKFNVLFQSRSISINLLQNNSICLFKNICQHFVKPHLINDHSHEIYFADKNNYLSCDEVFVEAECQSELKEIPENDKDIILEFKKNCFQFYLKAAEDFFSINA